MSEPDVAGPIAAYRASGAWQADPVRFRFLESLAERLQAQPEPVRRVLRERVRQELDAFTAIVVSQAPRTAAQPPALRPERTTTAPAERNTTVPAERNTAVRAEGNPAVRAEGTPAVRAEGAPAVRAEPVEALPPSLATLTALLAARAPAHDELPSVRRFREAWESGRTLDRLEQALARSPANAGPLNSHALVVRALALMGDASVDYLRRFLTYAESLQWLEAAKQQLPVKGGKPPARKKKGRA